MHLLAIKHSLSKSKIFFFPVIEVCQCSGSFITCIGVQFRAVDWIMRSGLASFPVCQGSCGIVPNGPTGSGVSFSIHHSLKY